MSSTRHPILADTSALVALGMSEFWETSKNSIKVTTTNICTTELKRHVRENHKYAPEGTRTYRLHHGSKRALEAFDDAECTFSVVTVVPAPTGKNAGDESLVKEILDHSEAYRYVVLNDATYRDTLRKTRDREGLSFRVVPPTYLLYVLFDNDELTKAEFCRSCGEMMRGEGWTKSGAVHEMWRAIPVDCSEFVDDRLLPE